MYATIIRIDLSALATSDERARFGRELAATLGTLDGFVAFVALGVSDGRIAAIVIFEDRESLDAAQHCFEHPEMSIEPLGAGELIAQRGL